MTRNLLEFVSHFPSGLFDVLLSSVPCQAATCYLVENLDVAEVLVKHMTRSWMAVDIVN